MTVLTILLGLLMIVGGVCLFSTPLATFIGTGYFIIILFFISSLVSIIKGISKKRFDKKFFFGILGVILPVYAVIDMIETAENVWSDSCVCAMVDKDLA
jgi:Na+/H+-dicarboxylate symporter